ncbi:hypothetical protein PoMZ_00436, partial [Pyricularia oryzae]
KPQPLPDSQLPTNPHVPPFCCHLGTGESTASGNLRSMTPAVLVLPLPRDNKPLARMWKDKQEQDLRCSRLWTAENVLTSPVVVE